MTAAQTLLDGYTGVVKTVMDKNEALDVKRAALRAHDRNMDQLNKRWYKVVNYVAEPIF